jgi:hypothetical protein
LNTDSGKFNRSKRKKLRRREPENCWKPAVYTPGE